MQDSKSSCVAFWRGKSKTAHNTKHKDVTQTMYIWRNKNPLRQVTITNIKVQDTVRSTTPAYNYLKPLLLNSKVKRNFY